MQKAPFIILPVMALVIIVLFYALLVKKSPASADGSTSSGKGPGSEFWSAAETARLKKELETLKKENEATRKRAEEAEARAAKLESESAGSASADPKKAAAKKGDWKKRRDAELEAKVKSMAWRKNVKGVLNYWKELEAARAEGRAVQFSPELVEPLNALQTDMNELSKFLGMEGESSYRVFQNEVVHEAWTDAILQEIAGGNLTEGQLAKLRGTGLYEPDQDWEFGQGNMLEAWKAQVENNQLFLTATAGVLTAEQHALISKTVTPAYLLSMWGYSERAMPGGAEAPKAVADYWQKSFNIPVDQRAVLEAAAADYARRLAEITLAVTAAHGGTLTREAEFDLLIKTIEAQVAAEKKLAETLQLDAEQLKKFQKSSGAVIKLAN